MAFGRNTQEGDSQLEDAGFAHCIGGRSLACTPTAINPPEKLHCHTPASRRDSGLIAFSSARLNCELVASSSLWRVPPDGRQACGRCSKFKGVTLASALTVPHFEAAVSAPPQCWAHPARHVPSRNEVIGPAAGERVAPNTMNTHRIRYPYRLPPTRSK